jgi:hypothetical protein
LPFVDYNILDYEEFDRYLINSAVFEFFKYKVIILTGVSVLIFAGLARCWKRRCSKKGTQLSSPSVRLRKAPKDKQAKEKTL